MGLDLIELAMQLETRFRIEFARDEYQTAFSGTAGSLCDFVWQKIQGVQPALLDFQDLHTRVRRALLATPGRPWWYRGVRVERLLGQTDLARSWDSLQCTLGVSLPALAEDPANGQVGVPAQCASVLRLTHWIAEHCPDRAKRLKNATTGRAPAAEQMTREECCQGVRQVLADVLDLDPEQVTPQAHLIEDLGMG
jgi:acyl carrier protein